MKKLFLVLALTGMVGAVSASAIRQDDKTKAKATVTTTKDAKTCDKESKAGCCKKEGSAAAKKACCKKETEAKK
ncbi:MAG: hypothetical protein ACK5D5_07165 [Bacteroidota bacterium]|jgi:hypothetical protein